MRTIKLIQVNILAQLLICFLFQEESVNDVKKWKGKVRRPSDLLKFTWKGNNNAERIFDLLPEKDTRCYSALIRGMVKVGFHVYQERFIA